MRTQLNKSELNISKIKNQDAAHLLILEFPFHNPGFSTSLLIKVTCCASHRPELLFINAQEQQLLKVLSQTLTSTFRMWLTCEVQTIAEPQPEPSAPLVYKTAIISTAFKEVSWAEVVLQHKVDLISRFGKGWLELFSIWVILGCYNYRNSCSVFILTSYSNAVTWKYLIICI